MPAPHRVLLLAFPNGQLLDIAGPLQMFAGANAELSRQVYRIEIAAPQAGPFATSSGLRLSLMLHLRKSRISASLASTHSSRLAASRACDRSLRAETQRTSWLGRLDACRGSPRFAAVHFS